MPYQHLFFFPDLLPFLPCYPLGAMPTSCTYPGEINTSSSFGHPYCTSLVCSAPNSLLSCSIHLPFFVCLPPVTWPYWSIQILFMSHFLCPQSCSLNSSFILLSTICPFSLSHVFSMSALANFSSDCLYSFSSSSLLPLPSLHSLYFLSIFLWSLYSFLPPLFFPTLPFICSLYFLPSPSPSSSTFRIFSSGRRVPYMKHHPWSRLCPSVPAYYSLFSCDSLFKL